MPEPIEDADVIDVPSTELTPVVHQHASVAVPTSDDPDARVDHVIVAQAEMLSRRPTSCPRRTGARRRTSSTAAIAGSA